MLPSAEHKRPLIDVGHPELSIRRPCELLGLSRSSLYYEPAGGTPEEFAAFIKQESAKWADVVKRSGAKLE